MSISSLELSEKIVKLLDNKKAEDIQLLKIGSVTTLGDYFVVASGNNTTLVKALADEVDNGLSLLGVEPLRIEGHNSSSWILMDYGDVIVHIFLSETRQFYGLERLWSDASQVDISNILTEN